MPPDAKPGRVHLVGAGPGAADLLTVRALRAIQGAGALLYDALISEEVLALAPADCLKIQTGKRAGRASMRQETINRLMLRLARRGIDVVRLKGGDPSIFGRVGEEQAFLRAHGIAVEVTPGVTAACAAAAQFGFPLTHRGEARRLVFSTATLEGGAAQGDWAAAGADPQTTLALYMGRDQLRDVARRLVDLGRTASTPVVAVENAGRAKAQAINGTLANIGEAVDAAQMDGPVVVLIGEVAQRALGAWPARRPQRRAVS